VKNTVSCTITFDTFSFGPQGTVQGAAISDWVTVTAPALTASISNPTTSASGMRYRRVGDSAEIQWYYTFSGAGSGTYRFPMPSGLVLDSTKIVSAFGAPTGGGRLYDSSGNVNFNLTARYDNSATGYITMTADGASVFTNTTPLAIASPDEVWVSVIVPISGWSSNTVLSNDTDTRVISAQAACSTAFAYSATTPINFDTVVVDRAGSVTPSATAWKFTAPVSGDYRVSTNLLNGTGSISVNLYKNGSLFRQLMSVTTAAITSASTTISLNAGDYIDIRGASAATLVAGSTTNTISVERLSGPATIAASENVTAHYRRTTADGNQSLSSGSSVVYFTGYYPSKVIDTHNFVTSSASDTYATIPVSGVYEIVLTNRLDTSAGTETFQSYIMSGGTNQTGTLTLDGTQLAACITQLNTVGTSGTAVYCGRFNAGDIVRFKMLRYAAVTTFLIGANFSGFTIKRVGN
jgi:hypothetical protein